MANWNKAGAQSSVKRVQKCISVPISRLVHTITVKVRMVMSAGEMQSCDGREATLGLRQCW